MSILRLVHRVVGLALAIPVILVALSGGALLLRDPYYRAQHPDLARQVTPSERNRWADALTTIERQFAPDLVRVVKFPREGMNAFHVYLSDGTEAFVDPRTNGVMTRFSRDSSAPAFLFDLHAHLLMGATGETLNGFGALAVVFLGLTGLMLWLPRRASFVLRRPLPRRAAPGELLRSHSVAGVLLLVPVILFSATGAMLVFYDQASLVLTRALDRSPAMEPDAVVPRRADPVKPWTDVLAAVAAALPEAGPRMYYPGGADNAVLIFRKSLPGELHPNGRSYVLVDPYTARVVQAIDARAQGTGTQAMHGVYPVHGAFVARVVLVPLAVLAAVGLTWLTATGTWAYLGRLRLRSRRRVPISASARTDLNTSRPN